MILSTLINLFDRAESTFQRCVFLRLGLFDTCDLIAVLKAVFQLPDSYLKTGAVFLPDPDHFIIAILVADNDFWILVFYLLVELELDQTLRMLIFDAFDFQLFTRDS